MLISSSFDFPLETGPNPGTYQIISSISSIKVFIYADAHSFRIA